MVGLSDLSLAGSVVSVTDSIALDCPALSERVHRRPPSTVGIILAVPYSCLLWLTAYLHPYHRRMRRYMYGVYVCASGLYLNNNNGSGGYSCKTCVPTVSSTIVVTRMYPYCTTNPKNNHHTRMYIQTVRGSGNGSPFT